MEGMLANKLKYYCIQLKLRSEMYKVRHYIRFIVEIIVSQVQTKHKHPKLNNRSTQESTITRCVQLNKLLESNQIVAQCNQHSFVLCMFFSFAFDIQSMSKEPKNVPTGETNTGAKRTTSLVSSDNLLTCISVMSSRQ